jgi:hypothetical protein
VSVSRIRPIVRMHSAGKDAMLAKKNKPYKLTSRIVRQKRYSPPLIYAG